MSAIKIINKATETLKTFNGAALSAALVIAALSAVGTEYSHLYSLAGQPASVYIVILAWFAIWTAVGYAAITLIFDAWNNGPSKKEWRTSPRQFALICMAGMTLSWALWITLHCPGVMRDDTLAQLFQYFGYAPYWTQHPIFDTLIFGSFFQLGIALGNQWIGLYLFLLIQAVITAGTFTYFLIYLRKHNVPRWFVFGSLIFYMAARVIYAPLNTMSKDALNGWSFALTCLFIVEIIRSNGTWLKKPKHAAAFVAVAVFCIASKRTMMLLIVPFMLLVGIVFLIRKQVNVAIFAIATGLLPAAIVTYVLTPAINSCLKPIQTTTYEMYSIPAQQIVRACKDNPSALTNEETTELESCFDIKTAIKVYNPHRSDEVNACWVPKASKAPFFKTWLSLAIKYPLSYLEAFESLSGTWMSLNTPISYNRDLHVLDSEEQMGFWNSLDLITNKNGAFDQFLPVPDPPTNIFNRVANILDSIQARVLPISSYGLYCFAIPFTVFIYALWKRNGPLFLAILIWAALFASFIVGPIALYWYTVPATFTAPLVLSLPYLLKKIAS